MDARARRAKVRQLWPQCGNAVCCYCDVPLKRYGDTSWLGATLDHWMPVALGGSSELENLRLCCRRCNNLKADMHPLVWLELPRPKYVHQPTRYERKVAALQRCVAVKSGAPVASSAEELPQYLHLT